MYFVAHYKWEFQTESIFNGGYSFNETYKNTQ